MRITIGELRRVIKEEVFRLTEGVEGEYGMVPGQEVTRRSQPKFHSQFEMLPGQEMREKGRSKKNRDRNANINREHFRSKMDELNITPEEAQAALAVLETAVDDVEAVDQVLRSFGLSGKESNAMFTRAQAVGTMDGVLDEFVGYLQTIAKPYLDP